MKLAQVGFRDVDSCHRAADAACDATGACNDVTNPAFDPKGTYAAAKTNATSAIDGACAAGDPVLDNYPGKSVEGATFPKFDETIGGNSVLVLGGADLDCDPVKVNCIEQIASSRSNIVNAVLRNSTACQRGKDRSATTFGAIDESCISAAAGTVADATEEIAQACQGISGPDVGSCDPLPDCVTTAARTAAQQLARDIYFVEGPPVCGNGTVEGSEQCDDGNTADGDGCNHLCESELGTCTPPSTPNAHRLVTVDITTPQPLAGVRVDLGYPIFEASVPGFGDSSVVRSRLTILQSGGLASVNDTDTTFFTVGLASANEFISSGGLFRVDFDNCVPVALNICNRSKNVTGCCNNTADPNQFGSCPAGTANAGTVCIEDADCQPFNPAGCTGAGTPNACCTGAGTGPTCIPGDASACTAAGTPFACCTDAGTGPSCTPQCPVKCFANPPVCRPGHFPQLVDNTPPFVVGPEIGPCDGTASGPAGGCPADNVCVSQPDITACSVSDPVDRNGTHVDGVTCSVAIVETPGTMSSSTTTTSSTSSTTSASTSTTTRPTTTSTSTTPPTTASTSTSTTRPTTTSTSTTPPTTTSTSTSTTRPTTTSTSTSTTTTTLAAVCGDGTVEPGETCDDGNTVDENDASVPASPPDTCPRTCRIDSCTAGTSGPEDVSVNLSVPAGAEVAGITVFLDYPDAKTSIPGSGNQSAVVSSIKNLPSNTISSPNDLDYGLLEGVLTSSPPIPAGRLFTVTFQHCSGAPALAASDFNCVVKDASDNFGNPITGVTCSVSIP